MAENLAVQEKIRNPSHFLPGQSGNPLGKPKGTRDYATIWREGIHKIAKSKNMTEEELEATLVASGFEKAFKDYRYFKDHLDRKVGKPPESLQLTGAGGGPIQFSLSAMLDRYNAPTPIDVSPQEDAGKPTHG